MKNEEGLARQPEGEGPFATTSQGSADGSLYSTSFADSKGDNAAAVHRTADNNSSLFTLHSSLIKEEARRLGFSFCGIAAAAPVASHVAEAYRRWIAARGHADMSYLADNIEKRLDPTLLLPGARSIIVVALNYAPERQLPDGEPQLAAYALGKDYHDVLKQRLRLLMGHADIFDPQAEHKIATDTVPILERYWAVQAGLGFIGRNHQLIIPRAGSMFFLGEIVTTMVASSYDEPCRLSCGSCMKCIENCPTHALTGHDFYSERCLSYQTIENRGPLSDEAARHIGNVIYGCDRCQQVCPWNRFATPTSIPELQPSEDLLQMRRDDWQQLSIEKYRALFRGSAVKRAKYEGLMRNIRALS